MSLRNSVGVGFNLTSSLNIVEAKAAEAPEPFGGDFFGQDYTAADFPGFDNPAAAGSDSDSDMDDDSNSAIQVEQHWEPERPVQPSYMDVDIMENPIFRPRNPLLRLPAHRDGIYVQTFGGRAGAPLPSVQHHTARDSRDGYGWYKSHIPSSGENIWAPFVSKMDWELAHWAKLRGAGSTAFSDLLAIDGVSEALGLSYHNSNELNNIIDKELPTRHPAFTREEVVIAGQAFDLYRRDILECIQALYGNPDHCQYLCFTPERHYADADKTIRLYHDFNTGKWWWDTQKAVEADKPGATIIPVIISSDKTQITLFRNKSAYPVYLTIGNLPKEIRRKPSQQGQILLAYLPTSRLEHITNKAARRRAVTNLFHACMKHLVTPLEQAGLEGVIMESGDGVKCRGHPILASYIGDYLEQTLVTTVYYGDCPTCDAEKNELETYPCKRPYRDIEAALIAIGTIGTDVWVEKCLEVNVKPVQHPFWENLPYTNIFASITPDILHQLYQGVMKHLTAWLTEICGADEIDARQLAHFWIFSTLHPIQFTVALDSFHENRDIFVDLGVRENFNLPKLHFLCHYSRAIKYYGTTDNYNTETTECLHIDLAKDAYRASNHKDEYAQMTRWLERREKIFHHTNYVAWRLSGGATNSDFNPESLTSTPTPDSCIGKRYDFPGAQRSLEDLKCVFKQKVTQFPTVKAVALSKLQDTGANGYHAIHFQHALKRFLVQYRDPSVPLNQVDDYARFVVLPFRSLPIWHKVKFINLGLYGKKTVDSISVHPCHINGDGEVIRPSRFDTALLKVKDEGSWVKGKTSIENLLEYSVKYLPESYISIITVVLMIAVILHASREPD
ncbi:hypothetical protein DFJ43DRAFT_1043218 [Lentinula guzmanii]|uniref:Uncharacterized protein n=1 Tax=Lentinula guzmanii TaxID=2804957 RepID=A0AA38JAY4_9AGAR|nr:hypothetical protein DFJ43DRAFT_1043218 [Lentinula guzmanii]